MRRIFSLIVLLSLSFPASVICQDQTAKMSENVEITLVEIPVNVVDRNGEPVRGLVPENFEVFDNGKRRAITHFEEVDLAKIAVEPEIGSSPVARRHFLLVFDLSHSDPKTLSRARNAARQFVDTTLDEDLVSISTYTVEEGFKILCGFSTDRAVVHRAILDLRNLWLLESGDPLLLATTVDPGLAAIQQYEFESNRDGIARESDEIERQTLLRFNDEYQRGRIKRQVRTFGLMAQYLDRIRGRKHVILLSEGFDSSLVQGREKPLSFQDAHQDMLWRTRGQIWRLNTDENFGNYATLTELGEMGTLFRRSDVVLHTIDINGVPQSSEARTGANETASESHYLLARPTGGQVFRHTNDLNANFAKLLRQQEVVYVLAFQTEPTGSTNDYHDLAVKVHVVGYRGLQVSHRAGYYESSPRMTVVEQRLSANDIMVKDIPYDDVEMNILAAPFPIGENESQVLVIVEIDGADLIRGAPTTDLNVELFLYAFDQDNRVRDFIFQTIAFDLSHAGAALSNSGVKYYGVLTVPAGHYAIKSLVRVGETGFNGFKRTNLRVPANNEPSMLPPLVFEEPGTWIMLKAARIAAGEIEYPFVLAEDSFIPSARPKMEAEGEYKLALFTYNVDLEDIELIARLQGADGKIQNPDLKIVGRTEADVNGMTKLLLDFSPRMLTPGDYSLYVSVRGTAENSPAEVSLPITIEGPSS